MGRVIALPLAVVAFLTLGTAVLAGGWATVEGAGPTDGQVAGTDTIVDLEVLQHGATAVSWPRITVNATNTATGEIVTTTATPTTGQTGHYTATLTFPTEGSWILSYDSPDLIMEGNTTLAVSAPVVATANASTVAADPTLVLGVSAAILVIVAATGALIVHARRPDRRRQTTAVSG